MRKLFVFMFIFCLCITLSSCTKNKGPVNRYVVLDSYDKLTNFVESARIDNKDGFDYLIPDYQFEGVNKKVYVLDGVCWDNCTTADDHESICTNFAITSFLVYCYTDENNGFILSFVSGKLVNGELIEKDSFKDCGEYYRAFLESQVANEYNLKPGVECLLFSSDENTTNKFYNQYIEDFKSEYTEEEARNWYDIVYNTLIDYHNIDEVN